MRPDGRPLVAVELAVELVLVAVDQTHAPPRLPAATEVHAPPSPHVKAIDLETRGKRED